MKCHGGCAVLSTRPFLRNGIDSKHAGLIVFILSLTFTQRPTRDRKIERSNLNLNARGFGSLKVLTKSIENFIYIIKLYEEKIIWFVTYQNLRESRPFLISKLVTRMSALFPQASQLLPAATAADSETPCVCARPTHPTCAGARPKSSAIDFAVKL